MRTKLDENLPSSLVEDLRDLGHDPDTVPGEGLRGHPDAAVWDAAQSSGRFLITQDLDFSDLRRFTPGTHAGILLLRMRQPGRSALRARVVQLFRYEDPAGWSRAFVVATDRRLRIRRPTRQGDPDPPASQEP